MVLRTLVLMYQSLSNIKSDAARSPIQSKKQGSKKSEWRGEGGGWGGGEGVVGQDLIKSS